MPDLATLRLCAMLTSMAFATVFLIFWARRPAERWFAHWAASAGAYGFVLIGFGLLPHDPPAALVGLLFCGLAFSDAAVLSGARAFTGRRPFAAWMWIGIVAIGLAGTAPALIGWYWGHLVQTFALTAGVILAGWPLLRDRTADGAHVARRIAGWAMIAYVPSYGLSLLGEHLLGRGVNLLSMAPLLADQILLAAINIGLLGIPGLAAHQAQRDASMRDALTGVWNRAALKAHEREVTVAGHAVLLIDIDHFKAINDRHGHASGDTVLIHVAEILAQHAAVYSGWVLRMGGDEFMMIVPRLRAGTARRFAERVRRAAARSPEGCPDWSISLGLAFVEAGETSLAPAMMRADRLLYEAKHEGRDRIAA